jgi:hypothetical protein
LKINHITKNAIITGKPITNNPPMVAKISSLDEIKKGIAKPSIPINKIIITIILYTIRLKNKNCASPIKPP